MVYIALVRGINIGPHKRMPMQKLCASCAACGFQNPKTYIQSGNVVFTAPKMAAKELAGRLEKQILVDFRFSAGVICRTYSELAAIIGHNPLLHRRGVDPEKFHVGFLAQAASPEAVKKLQRLTLAPDLSLVKGKEVYLYFPNGHSGSSLWKYSLDKILETSATIRNWRTVTALSAMAADCK